MEFSLNLSDRFIQDKELKRGFTLAILLNTVGIWGMINKLIFQKICPNFHKTSGRLIKLYQELINSGEEEDRNLSINDILINKEMNK